MKKHLVFLSLIVVIILTACISKKEAAVVDDVRTISVHDRLNKAYGFDAENIQVITVDSSDYYDVMLFTFKHENRNYIGDSGYKQKIGGQKVYSTENMHYINIHMMNDTDTPFTYMSSTSSAKYDEEEPPINYYYYYGWINDHQITDVVIDFSDQIMHIKPTDNMYYSSLRINHKYIKSVKGIDYEDKIVHEINLFN